MTKKLLVVDDNQQNRYMLRALLEGHGYEVSEAEDGRQALDSARSEPPDAVITDLLMPKMDGFALCREWTRSDELRPIPIIVYSATYTDPKDRQLAFDAGASEFIVKPSEPEEILRTILEAIRLAQPPRAQDESSRTADFFERYSSRLAEKLGRKLEQLSATKQTLAGYVTRCEAILDASPSAIVAIDSDQRICAWNFSAERMFGYCEADVLGQPIGMLIPPDRAAQAQRLLSEVGTRKEVLSQETRWLRQSGASIEVSLSLSFLGPEIGFVAVLSDLSELRRVTKQRKQLEEQLTLAQRMESVGLLAGGIAHDFNNLLTVILGHADMIRRGLTADSPIHKDAKRIAEASQRASALTRQILTFSRRGTIEPEVLSLNDTVRSMEGMLRRLIGEDVALDVDLAEDLGRIEADLSQVEQVILNLVVNARDAMPDGGRLSIRTKSTVIREDNAATDPLRRAGHFAMLMVTDTGTGMSEQTRAQAFDPYFTTKERGKGTGLGLATTHGIVERSGGFIWIHTELGRGTTLEIYWPRVNLPVPSPESSSPPVSAGAGGETILLVEDEAMVRDLAQQVLERAGYRILATSGAAEALQLLEQSDEPIDLLLTDVVMPSMDGPELARRVSALRPTISVLFTSGYTDDALAHRGALDPGVSLVHKPFSAAGLTKAVHAALGGHRDRTGDER